MEYKIWYHGTNQKNAKSILKNGFNKHTFFARHLEDALGYGGNYIFEIALKLEHKYWEYVSREIIKKDKIVSLQKHEDRTIMYENKKLGDDLFEYNLKKVKEENNK